MLPLKGGTPGRDEEARIFAAMVITLRSACQCLGTNKTSDQWEYEERNYKEMRRDSEVSQDLSVDAS